MVEAPNELPVLAPAAAPAAAPDKADAIPLALDATSFAVNVAALPQSFHARISEHPGLPLPNAHDRQPFRRGGCLRFRLLSTTRRVCAPAGIVDVPPGVYCPP